LAIDKLTLLELHVDTGERGPIVKVH
jgi:hypothetical protein